MNSTITINDNKRGLRVIRAYLGDGEVKEAIAEVDRLLMEETAPQQKAHEEQVKKQKEVSS